MQRQDSSPGSLASSSPTTLQLSPLKEYSTAHGEPIKLDAKHTSSTQSRHFPSAAALGKAARTLDFASAPKHSESGQYQESHPAGPSDSDELNTGTDKGTSHSEDSNDDNPDWDSRPLLPTRQPKIGQPKTKDQDTEDAPRLESDFALSSNDPPSVGQTAHYTSEVELSRRYNLTMEPVPEEIKPENHVEEVALDYIDVIICGVIAAASAKKERWKIRYQVESVCSNVHLMCSHDRN